MKVGCKPFLLLHIYYHFYNFLKKISQKKKKKDAKFLLLQYTNQIATLLNKTLIFKKLHMTIWQRQVV